MRQAIIHIVGRMDRQLLILSGYSGEAGAVVCVQGLVLIVFAALTNMLFVEFDGQLTGGEITAADGMEIVTKQVGYFLALNWSLTGVVLLPAALKCALGALNELYQLPRKLNDNRMLVNSDFSPVSVEFFEQKWKSTRTFFFCLGFFVCFFVMIMLLVDYISVVLTWNLLSPDDVPVRINENGVPVTLNHDTYEFDWSISSIFHGANVDAWAAIVLSAMAYLLIAVIGATFLFFFFFYVIGVGVFMSTTLRRNNILLIPNVTNVDDSFQFGFQIFRRFFNCLIGATLATAAIALCMFLQNMYLRAADQNDIVSMIFGPLGIFLEALIDDPTQPDWQTLFTNGLFENTFALTGYPGIAMQVWASALIMFLLATIVLYFIWFSLRDAALAGLEAIRDHDRNNPEEALISEEVSGSLEKFSPWPATWASTKSLGVWLLLIGACAIYPRILTLFLAAALGYAIWRVLKSLKFG